MGREGGTRWERPRALLLFTDEESEAYLGAVLRGLVRLPRWAGAVRHGDALVAEQLRAAGADARDNFLVYATGGLLMANGALHFVMDRSRGCRPHANSSFPLHSGS